MAKLSNFIKDSIIDACMKDRFDEQLKKLEDEGHELAELCYTTIYDEKQLKIVYSLEEVWFTTSEQIKVNAGGYSVVLNFKERKRFPYNAGHTLAIACPKLTARVQKYAERKEELNKERRETRQKLTAFIYSFGSIKQLKATWPEGKKYYSSWDVEQKTNLPALPIQEINSLLRLNKK